MARADKHIFSQPGGGRGKLFAPTRGATYMGTYQMPDGKMDRRMFNCPNNAAAIKAYMEWCEGMDARILEAMSASRAHPKEDRPDRRRERRRLEHKRYYAETAFKYERREWTEEEDEQVLAHSVPDRELSSLIRRSMKSISNRRWRLLMVASMNNQTGGAGD